ncbi:zinc transporter ZIP9-like isoform X2 [Corticium candelabrum]|uniref:zinc transporter ZIP9-like isoform X2 n=1 Tax=Corticium candelabrum TaxID=121492 RepID=UPI002E26ED68|nr:zinc transporter ZIP9-like isoform X2 [Corticium candelabrum]
MDEFWSLILLSIAMLIGSYVAGSIPLMMTLSEKRLRLVTVLGAGLLVGTALSVIIPEGVHALYTSEAHHSHSSMPQQPAVEQTEHNKMKEHQEKPDMFRTHEELHHGDEHNHSSSSLDLHSYIGISITLGFVFMLLLDQIGGSHFEHHGSDGDNSRSSIFTATIGLVVHAAADGIAMGAAATTAHHEVEIIVFLAIMLHKAPAAFGLATFLLHEGCERTRIRKHLVIFSAAAPVMALITYIGLNWTSTSFSSINATGVAMLFSAGTFLYVATVHVLQEVSHVHTNHSTQSCESSSTGTGQKGEMPLQMDIDQRHHNKHSEHLSKFELIALVAGILSPMLLQLQHSH